MLGNSMVDNKLLYFVDYEHPILRQEMHAIEFPLSQEDQDIIDKMKYSIQGPQLKAAGAPWEVPAGMAANQWGINKRIFLYCPTGDTINQLEVVINPSYQPLATTSQDLAWEGCFSVPLATGNIQRNTHILVKYQNESGEHIERELIGWEARVWQHENDHLDGYLYDDHRSGKCLEKKVFANYDEVTKFYEQLRLERKK
jgi:peptide deformylase